MSEIKLRPLAPEDGPALSAIFDDDEVFSWLAPLSAPGVLGAAEHALIAERKAAHWRAHGFGQWLALLDAQPVGRGGLQHTIVDGRSEIEIGWAVARPHWGEGVGSHIARQGMRLARELGIAGVVAFTRHDNHRSLALIARCGMIFEREFEYRGQPQLLYRHAGSG